jgi:hypothetical protein
MQTTFKIIGFTDKVNECDCCGKTDLKGTYAIDVDGQEMYYGSVCAANTIGVDTKAIKKAVSQIKTIENIDLAMSQAKAEATQVKIYIQAIKKGYSKNEFFIKYGVIDHVSKWETYYNFAHLTHAIEIEKIN